MTKVIAFNGPPQCGKDFITQQLLKIHGDAFAELKMAHCLKRGVHELLGLADAECEAYNDKKDEPLIEFFHKTPREVYIDMAENFIKTRFGHEAFGHMWLRNYQKRFYNLDFDTDISPVMLISDCGFPQELQPLIRHFGKNQIILFRIHRKGKDFTRDSRSYIHEVVDREYDVENPNNEPDKFVKRIHYHLEEAGVLAEI